MEDSPVLLKQEKDVVNTILSYKQYSESDSILAIELTRFEGKHFRHLTPDATPGRLLKRIKEILTLLKQRELVNDFTLPSSVEPSLNSIIEIDIQHKIGKLKQYWIDLDKKISKLTSVKVTSQDKNLYSEPKNMHPNIIALVPNTKLTRKAILPMTKLFNKEGIGSRIDNSLLFQCIDPTADVRSYKILQKANNKKIEYRIRTIRKYIEPLGLTIKHRFDYSCLSHIGS